MKRVSFKTIGCRLNQAETAQMESGFESAGYRVVPFGAPCDACVIHTCAITDTAEKKSCAYARRASGGAGDPVVVLAGCATEVSARDLARVTGADLIVGQDDKFRIPQLLEARSLVHPQSDPAAEVDREPGPQSAVGATRALVKVQDGCSFRCAYCVVPRARGVPRSRPLADVHRDVRRLAGQGYREVVVTGANLGLYADGAHCLPDLLTTIESVRGIDRIRLSSIELSTVNHALIDSLAASPKFCPSLHLPLQSGDDRILSAMRRRYTAGRYREFVEYALERIPGLGLGSDIMTGFPGEETEHFRNTVSFVQELPFSNLHVFPYSERAGTTAADLPGAVPPETRKTRAAHLIEIGNRKRRDFAEHWIGRPVSILIERVDADGIGAGWTREYIRAQVRRPGLQVNDIVESLPRMYDLRRGMLVC